MKHRNNKNSEQTVLNQAEPLKVLNVIDTLLVGPVKVEKKRASALYTVCQGEKKEQMEFIYSFEEDVFQPDSPDSRNLASMMLAQVAINYGLFCKKIVFRGLYNEQDEKFIQEVMENTAREIYVKKFLEPNPFLIGDAVDLPVMQLQKYNQAVIEFESTPENKRAKWHLWDMDKNNHAILSSGGKDSLLTFGLLDELKKPVFPIFINESGRHWFTALNAYRYFKENIPNTKKVWTNSDRVFNWMLRQMPFIRKNFASIRSDEYPVRLWTVAVFLFGALPLLRKHKIGRLLIGDEYDTTVKANFQGIMHYDGLYDQSRYFDNYLSRYFMKKGWSISQFSILRSLSEMLIEKILVERYPHLQKQQISCHAALQAGDRIYPCGKCEKCRRIVAMLTAIGADPEQCGYSQEQIKNCLAAIATKGIHQESEGVKQLFYMLLKQGKISLPDPKKLIAKEKPEILKLRFDSERSPFETFPKDLRESLYHILVNRSNGAVKQLNRKWTDFDPLLDPGMYISYPFEMESNQVPSDTLGFPLLSEPVHHLWGELTWPQAEQRLKEIDVALLPVGAIEQHGPHLPLDTDAFDADYLAKKVAEACSNPKPLVLPLIPYGVSYHHAEFQGTVTIGNDTLSRLVYEIGMSVAKNGIKKLIIINGHGGNEPALNYAGQMINRDAHIFVAVDTGETSDVDIDAITETPNDVHAGEIETSTTMAIRPNHVKMSLATKFIPNFSSRYLNFSSKRGVTWHAYTNKISSSGVMGDPTKASAEKGEKIWEIMIAHLVALVEDLKSLTLEELYQKRY